MKKEIKQQKKKKKKTASSPDQDLHPDWDCFCGTMLYPLSCGELAMKGEQMLRWYVTSGVRNARNKWTKILRKKGFDSKKTLRHYSKSVFFLLNNYQMERRFDACPEYNSLGKG